MLCSAVMVSSSFGEATPSADFDSDTWTILTVPGGYLHKWPSVQICPDQIVHIAAFNDGGGMSYWTYDGLDWSLEPVSESDVWRPSLALDSSGEPFIAAFDYSTESIMLYEREASGQWNSTSVYGVSYGQTANQITLKIDSQDNPHIVARISNASKIVYLHHDGYQWEVKDDFGDYDSIDLALDSNDNPRISYYYDSHLCCTFFDQGQWWNSIISPASGWSSIDVSSGDETSIIKVTQNDITICQNVGPGWAFTSIDSSVNLLQPDLLISPDGDMMVVYHDGFNDDLRYAVNTGNGWEWFVLDWEGYTGLYPSVATDGQGHYGIAYYDNNPNLKLAVYGSLTSIINDESVLENQLSMHILNNPAKTSLSICCSLPEAGEVTLSVFSIDGRLVHRRGYACTAGDNTLTVNGLPSGVFYVRLDMSGLTATERVSIIRD